LVFAILIPALFFKGKEEYLQLIQSIYQRLLKPS
jgi:hypothetical protein